MDKRRATRYAFFATVEVIEVMTDTRMNLRTSDLSLVGCYVDTINPLPAGTDVRLRITHNEQTFETLGSVRHVETGMGMGVSFAKIEPNQRKILEKWIAEASEQK